MNHNNDQCAIVGLRRKDWDANNLGNQQLCRGPSWLLKSKGIMPGIEDPSEIFWNTQVIDLGGESTTTNLLNNPNLYLHSLDYILVSTRKYSFHPSTGNFCVQQMETITESHNRLKHNGVDPIPTDTLTTQVPHLRLRQGLLHKKGQKDCKS